MTTNVTPETLEMARQLGRGDGIAAASWAANGNADAEHIRRVLAMIGEGDPMADDYLPAYPTLSGVWADDRTPRSLAREVLGDDSDAEAVDEIADAWEAGVSETFYVECERVLRALLPGDAA